ncbi:MAG: hypothetical protein ABJH04_07830 [Cyclobacteriaceae bacterium]
MREIAFAFFFVFLIGCSDQFEVEESYLIYESPTLHISNGSGIFYDTINLSRQPSYSAQLKYSHGSIPGNVEPVVFGDGSFNFKESIIDNKEIGIITSITRPGMYSFQYYWLLTEPNCNRIIGDIVLIRVIAVNDEVGDL